MNPVSKQSQLHGWKPGPKPKRAIRKVSSKKKFKCSDGTLVSQVYINNKLSSLRAHKPNRCECCGEESWVIDVDHTLAQRICKEMEITEQIWSRECISYSCRECHREWEGLKSLVWEEHKNVIKRLLYLKKWAPVEFEKRRQCLSNSKVINAVK